MDFSAPVYLYERYGFGFSNLTRSLFIRFPTDEHCQAGRWVGGSGGWGGGVGFNISFRNITLQLLEIF